MTIKGQIDFEVKCENCKGDIVVTDVDGTTIYVDSFSCNCDRSDVDVDCGFDDRVGRHAHLWINSKGVAAYCMELQKELQETKNELWRLKHA